MEGLSETSEFTFLLNLRLDPTKLGPKNNLFNIYNRAPQAPSTGENTCRKTPWYVNKQRLQSTDPYAQNPDCILSRNYLEEKDFVGHIMGIDVSQTSDSISFEIQASFKSSPDNQSQQLQVRTVKVPLVHAFYYLYFAASFDYTNNKAIVFLHVSEEDFE